MKKDQDFPFSEKGNNPAQLHLKLQLKASEQFPAGMVHPDGLKHNLTSSRLGIRQGIGACGWSGAGGKTGNCGCLQF